jgi:exosome complex component RRP42
MYDSKKQLLKYYKDGVRFDGRKMGEYRPVKVEYGVSGSAEGSARVTIGGTVVIAGVKMALETPYSDTPDKGNLMINVELLPLSSPEFETGPPGIQAIELARVTDRGIRESKAIDVKKLCLRPGEKVWSVMIDICSVNDEGNLFDAAGLAAIAALKDARFPKLEKDVVNYEEKTDTPIPMDKEPVPITVLKIGDQLIVDPVSAEEKVADARITVAVCKDGTVSAMQKGGKMPLSIEDVDNMVGLAIKTSGELRKNL